MLKGLQNFFQFWVFERLLMVVPPGFEIFGDAYIEMRVWVLRRGLVYDVASVAFPVEGAVFLSGGLAVAFR